ncbi:DUF6907 domain-containing protein [Streptomyces sp. N50]|uniref:DUF6907 domain-containing protein n=1 Tax=Streptomyces sp. N50 TaxID=3081765 RepID=UPI0029624509|nr:hypothetical protein [Streptomyces sp. N50]WOX09185.1 hypothetical protein R2B38_09925 [Streptomyces sp. N50]
MAKSAISTPMSSPGFEFVAARIGLPGRTTTVLIECPTSWCTVNHFEVREVAVEDITHYGPGTFLGIPTMSDDETDLLELYVNITSDPASDDPRMQAAHLIVSNSSGQDADLTNGQGEELADSLVRMAAEIRQALRVCQSANRPVLVDSDPSMDEALRRVRGEAV